MDLLEALRAEGVDVRPEPDWKTRTAHKLFTPVGVVVHHTAGQGDGGFRVIRDGRAGIPGPLATVHPRKDGSVHLLTAGKANHAGKGSKAVLSLTKKGIAPPGDATVRFGTNGNRWYYGIEIENLGRGLARDPYPAIQLDASIRCAAAICGMQGWTAERVIAHKE